MKRTSDNKPDIAAATDRGEPVSLMEPLLISESSTYRGARQVLEAVLYRGELPRGEIPALLGVGERQSRRVVSALMEKNVLASDTQKSPVYLKFPAALASRWMPGLFPEKTDSEA